MTFRKVGEEQRYAGPVISVSAGQFVAPDGTEFEREVVHHPGAVAVVPLLDDGRVVLVRQFRAPVESHVLEIPAGKRDVEGEANEVTAARELEEEVGLRAGRLEPLCSFYNSPGISDERCWIFLGRDLQEVPTDLHGPEEEHMTVEHVRLDDVPALIAAGELVDSKTVIGLLVARDRVG